MAIDYFLKLDGVPGESHDATHHNEIDLLSFSWGANQPGNFAQGTGGSGGKVSMSDFSFTMQSCKATTELMAACASGKHIASAILYCRKSTGDGGQQELSNLDHVTDNSLELPNGRDSPEPDPGRLGEPQLRKDQS